MVSRPSDLSQATGLQYRPRPRAMEDQLWSVCRGESGRWRFPALTEVTSATVRLPRRDSASPTSVSDLLGPRVPQVSLVVTELQAAPACREVVEPLELQVKTATPGSPVVMERTDCPEPEVCLARTDWTESRDLLGLRDCRDLRDLLELPGHEAGSETRERPDLQDLWDHRDPPAKTAAMVLLAQPDRQV